MCFIDGCIQTEAVRTLESEGYHFRTHSAPSSCNERKHLWKLLYILITSNSYELLNGLWISQGQRKWQLVSFSKFSVASWPTLTITSPKLVFLCQVKGTGTSILPTILPVGARYRLYFPVLKFLSMGTAGHLEHARKRLFWYFKSGLSAASK